MLTSIQSAGVAPEVNLRNSLHTGDKAHKWGIHPGFETQGRHCQKPQNRGISGPTKRTYVLKKFLKKSLQLDQSWESMQANSHSLRSWLCALPIESQQANPWMARRPWTSGFVNSTVTVHFKKSLAWMVSGEHAGSQAFLPFTTMWYSNGIIPGKTLNGQETMNLWLPEMCCYSLKRVCRLVAIPSIYLLSCSNGIIPGRILNHHESMNWWFTTFSHTTQVFRDKTKLFIGPGTITKGACTCSIFRPFWWAAPFTFLTSCVNSNIAMHWTHF